nr:hypothetical protein [Sodalis glossinidius]
MIGGYCGVVGDGQTEDVVGMHQSGTLRQWLAKGDAMVMGNDRSFEPQRESIAVPILAPGGTYRAFAGVIA